jgi:hypothetical protein
VRRIESPTNSLEKRVNCPTAVVSIKLRDARLPRFNSSQQASTSCLHLIETKHVANRALSRKARNRLGQRGSVLSKRSTFNYLKNRPPALLLAGDGDHILDRRSR